VVSVHRAHGRTFGRPRAWSGGNRGGALSGDPVDPLRGPASRAWGRLGWHR
jgi:hypothetical protein